MKSRWTTGVLLVVVAAVWGVVAWKIFRPHPPATVVAKEPPCTTDTVARVDFDTLCCDYPDPFLKNNGRTTARPAVRALPLPAKRQPPRERVRFEHLGSVRSGSEALHIVLLDGQQYELRVGEAAEEFVLAAADADSLYFEKEGLTYGVERCE